MARLQVFEAVGQSALGSAATSRVPQELSLMGRLHTLAIGTFAFLISMVSVVFFATNAGPQFDTVIIDDHVVGGPSDRFVALVIGTLSGAVAVVCAIRPRRPH